MLFAKEESSLLHSVSHKGGRRSCAFSLPLSLSGREGETRVHPKESGGDLSLSVWNGAESYPNWGMIVWQNEGTTNISKFRSTKGRQIEKTILGK